MQEMGEAMQKIGEAKREIGEEKREISEARDKRNEGRKRYHPTLVVGWGASYASDLGLYATYRC
jgi:hypothetical protein